MKNLVRSFFLFLLLALPVAAAPKLGLQPGELLDYRVGWGIFTHAGEIKINARSEINDQKPCTVVTATTTTRGVVSAFFRFEAQAESVFDTNTGRMLVHTETSAGGKKKTNTALELNYDKSNALFTDFMNSANNETVQIPDGSPMDLIMSLVQTRIWNLKPGEQRDTDVVFGKEIYELTVHALRYEEVETPLGTFNTLVLEPRMEKTPPKGMFKRGSQVHVWIAQNDKRHLPVKFEVEFQFGAGVATLVNYEPPAAVAVEAPPAAATAVVSVESHQLAVDR